MNKVYRITISQGREAFVGSSFLCESARHATKPPKPAPKIRNGNAECMQYLSRSMSYINLWKE